MQFAIINLEDLGTEVIGFTEGVDYVDIDNLELPDGETVSGSFEILLLCSSLEEATVFTPLVAEFHRAKMVAIIGGDIIED